MVLQIEINDEFRKAVELINGSNKNLFVTGKAGTGKSTLLNYLHMNTDKRTVLLAPTGVAALNIKGQTIHRFFNFYIDVSVEKIKSKKSKPRNAKLYKNIEVIIIDETSMLRADLLDCIDEFLRIYGPDSSLPFGGIQMVFVGDLYQLPPVVSRDERQLFEGGYYNTPYFFSANVLQNFPLEIVELKKVYRQKDAKFIEVLNKIRNNLMSAGELQDLNTQLLQQSKEKQATDFYINLCTTNAMADEINNSHINNLIGRSFISAAEIKGDFSKEYYPTNVELAYKLGAQIMLLNNDAKKRWVNGSVGTIEKIETNEEGEKYLKVRLQENRKLVDVIPYTWEVFKFVFDGNQILSEAVGSFRQFPFRLAWAITIHKSQGKTFDFCEIDIGAGTFASGQLYVALSRCTTLEGITIKRPIHLEHIKIDERIIRYCNNDCA